MEPLFSQGATVLRWDATDLKQNRASEQTNHFNYLNYSNSVFDNKDSEIKLNKLLPNVWDDKKNVMEGDKKGHTDKIIQKYDYLNVNAQL